MEHNDELQNYRRDRLSAADRAALEKRLQSEPALAEELRRRRELQAAIGTSDTAGMKAELQALEARLATPTKVMPLRRNRLRLWLAAASVALLVLAGGWLFRQFNTATGPADLYAAYYAPYPNALAPVVRGETDLTPRERAMAAYEGGDYAGAAAQLAALPDPNLDSQFYQAVSLLGSARTGEAIELLERLSSERFDYQSQAWWYLALANLRAERVGEARAALEALRASDGDYRTAEVATLLEALTKD